MKICKHFLLITGLMSGLIFQSMSLHGQEILPPAMPWKGKSMSLVSSAKNQWITPAEKSSFVTTPDYQETMQWLEKLTSATNTMEMVTIGKSANGRAITMVIATSGNDFSKAALATSAKPLVLIQAGIHAGEIDGKDAGLMLLRDIAFGGKKDLLSTVNILFIPILNVDGHERSSPYNRVNQRGPQNMGWRTNARNLNLNRDYTKLDTEELKSVVAVINAYAPDLYLDLHVTDGADYQYDITYGFGESYSPAIAEWLKTKVRPFADGELQRYGHIPGPLVFAANDIDFTDGMTEYAYSGRFSNGYGDLIHLPTILVENHSLKPFKQRVLGTYVFLEAILKVLSAEAGSLKKAIDVDRALRNREVVLDWERSAEADTVSFLGIASSRKQSVITGSEYVAWSGKPVTQRIPVLRYNKPKKITPRPSGYWVPATHQVVIERLKAHGIQMETLSSTQEVSAGFYKISNYKFSPRPVEGHFMVSGDVDLIVRQETFYPGSVRIPTDQPLGDLVIHLLHPGAPDSFFQWGFFPEIFSRTEYMEQYVTEPLAAKMLADDPSLREAFETKKRTDADFARSPSRIYEWFYERSPYFDKQWLVYPVGISD